MKTFLSLTLMTILLNAMSFCSDSTKSSNSEKNSKMEKSEMDVRSYKLVHVYYPPGKTNEEEYTDIEKAVWFQMQYGVANNCTIIDHASKSRIVYVPRPRKNKNNGNTTNINGNILESLDDLLKNNENQSNYGYEFTAKSESYANVPEHAKSSRSASANGQSLEAAKRRAYELLLSGLSNDYNQLSKYNDYCEKEIIHIEEILNKIHYYAEENNSYRFHEIKEIIEKWYDGIRTEKIFEDFKENHEYNFLGNSSVLEKQVRNIQKTIDRQLETKYYNHIEKNAGKKCIDKIYNELQYSGNNWSQNVLIHIGTWNRQCNEIDKKRYGK